MNCSLEAKKQPCFIDIFAGCGGLSLGLLKAGWRGLFAIEQEQNAFSTLEHNLLGTTSVYQFEWPQWLPKTPHSIGILLSEYKARLEGIEGTVDMIVGGPPCQGFSSAGRRASNDPRNKLIEQYLQFVRTIRPRLVVLENVRGITADFPDGEKPGATINYARWLIKELSKTYRVHSSMLDTSKFGVPQRRERFFVIAVRKDISDHFPASPFAELETERPAFLRRIGIPTVPVGAESAISDLELTRNGSRCSKECTGFLEIRYKEPLTSFQRLMNGGETKVADTRLARHAPHIRARFKRLISICTASGRLNVSLSAEWKASLGLKKCAIRVMDPERPSPTITSMPDDLIHYGEPRTLTVRENARLQTFPDWFAFQGKYTTGGERRKTEIPRFTQVANAVPPLVAEAIGIFLAQRLLAGPLLGSLKESD